MSDCTKGFPGRRATGVMGNGKNNYQLPITNYQCPIPNSQCPMPHSPLDKVPTIA
ncbi:MAG: hypothetical protein KME31_22135 [Tolypothrix carrinoi HA7290-LM1]|nr:hypothetical protein [Tolypothrix carrinoi HA7290-LM1]